MTCRAKSLAIANFQLPLSIKEDTLNVQGQYTHMPQYTTGRAIKDGKHDTR